MTAAGAGRSPRRGLVLGSGGVLGFAWLLGALAALEDEAGFAAADTQVVIGTSAGSVGAALLGCGLPVDVISRHHQGNPAADDPAIGFDYVAGVGEALPPRPGWRPAAPRLLLDAVRHPGTVSPLVALTGLLPSGRASLAPVRDLVEGVARSSGFADSWPAAPRPWIVAADQRTGRRVVFGKDDAHPRPGEREVRRARLAEAVQASCSIPAWYPPTVIGGVPYVDGGAVSIASVDLARDAGLDEVYVLAPMASVDPDRPHSAVGQLERRVRKVITRRIERDVAALRVAGLRVVLVTPDRDDLAAMGANLMDARRRTEVLHLARSTAAVQVRRQLAGASRSANAG